MGRRIVALAQKDHRFILAAALTRAGSASIGQTIEGGAVIQDAAHRPVRADVIVDFSSPQGLGLSIDLARALRAALVCGTTGLTDAHKAALRDASRDIPVLWASNMSAGVAALAAVLPALARRLGPAFRASIVETHHAGKKDAPSGTALRLADALRSGGADLPPDRIASIRAGDVVGEHAIRLEGPAETIELTHRAGSRDLFALGALRAAAFLAGKPPGWYAIEDSLG